MQDIFLKTGSRGLRRGTTAARESQPSFRAFIAIDLPDHIKKSIAAKIKTLQKIDGLKGQNIKWVKPDNLHLTLCFLGKISYEQSLRLDQKIRDSLKNFPSFSTKLMDLQLPPTANDPIALVLNPKPLAPLKKLAQILKECVTACGLGVEKREFKPHLTLGRINTLNKKGGRPLKQLSKQSDPHLNFITIAVKLFKSEPQEGGSVYIPIAVYPLLKDNLSIYEK